MPQRRSSTAKNGSAARGTASGRGSARRETKIVGAARERPATGRSRPQDIGVDLVMSALPGVSEEELDALRLLLGDELNSLVKGR